MKRTLFVSLTTLLIFFAIFPMLLVRPVHAESFNINISPSTGLIGTRVVVNGTLAHVGAQFRIFWQYIKDWDGRYGFLTSGYAEGYNYTATTTIPPSKAGPHYIIVEDEKDHSTIATIFTVTPEITAEPSEGPAGTKVTVSGRLINNETIGIVFYNPASESGALVVEAQTDNNGYLVANFTVPQSSPGDYKIRAYWNNTLQSEVSFPFKLYPPPVVNVEPSAGLPGTRVTVTGSNFVPDSSVTVFFDDENPVATVITNGDGNFSTIFQKS